MTATTNAAQQKRTNEQELIATIANQILAAAGTTQRLIDETSTNQRTYNYIVRRIRDLLEDAYEMDAAVDALAAEAFQRERTQEAAAVPGSHDRTTVDREHTTNDNA